MICMPCRLELHASCDNREHGDGTWCDCQHKDRDGVSVIVKEQQ